MQHKKDIEIKWQAAIYKAKEYVKVKATNQMIIAGIALDVCEITWGGAHHSDKYTISRFAKEIGIDSKTLSNWIVIHRRVYEKVGKKESDKVSFTKLMVVANRVSNDAEASHVKEIFKEVTQSNSYEETLLRYLGQVRSLAFHFDQKNAAEKISKKTCEETLFFLNIVSRAILKKHPGLTGKQYGFAKRSRQKNYSAAAALNIPRNETIPSIKVTDSIGQEIILREKDRKVIDYMKRNQRFVTPTELGMKVHGLGESSASAWGYRSLQKLLALEYVERNDKGHYKWIGE